VERGGPLVVNVSARGSAGRWVLVAMKFHHLEILLWPRPQATTTAPDTRTHTHTHTHAHSCNHEREKQTLTDIYTAFLPTEKPRTQKVESQTRGSGQGHCRGIQPPWPCYI